MTAQIKSWKEEWAVPLLDVQESVAIEAVTVSLGERNDSYCQSNQTQWTSVTASSACAVALHLGIGGLLLLSWNVAEKAHKMNLLQPSLALSNVYIYPAPISVITPLPVVESLVEPLIVVQAQKLQFEVNKEERTKESQAINEGSGNEREEGMSQESAKSVVKFDPTRARQSYLRKLNEAQLATSITQQQNQQQYGSLSEMTPEFQSLQVPLSRELNTALTLDSSLDPNRIFKDGHLCKRVVAVHDPLNPHLAMLDSGLKCGLTDQEKALKASLEKYIKR